ncbi:MAG: NADH-quinone oxidoreductase subunit I [Dehalococcoidia bacterium]|nr:MAG: NADH-quinone oxidoreductase subunit I [Dehalococcoidia bacterium]
MNGLGILKAMAVTMKHFFRKPVTVQYPEERLPVPARIRGTSFVWYEDRCVGCSMCAKACPHGVIVIETHPHAIDPSRRVVDRYDFHGERCMYCGLCVEACPFAAVFMGSRYELATYDRRTMYITKQQLIDGPNDPSEFAVPEYASDLPDRINLPLVAPSPRAEDEAAFLASLPRLADQLPVGHSAEVE